MFPERIYYKIANPKKNTEILSRVACLHFWLMLHQNINAIGLALITSSLGPKQKMKTYFFFKKRRMSFFR